MMRLNLDRVVKVWHIALGVAVMIGTVGATWGVTQYRISSVEDMAQSVADTRIAVDKADAERWREWRINQSEAMAEMRAQIESISRSTDRIERILEKR